MISKYSTLLYTFLLVIIVAVFIYIYFLVTDIQQNLSKNVDDIILNNAKELAQNIDARLQTDLHGRPVIKTFYNDETFRKNITKELSLLATSSFRYVYILYKDKRGKYRYLADGSHAEKGTLGQPLDVDQSKWDKVYQTKKETVLYQQQFQTLWTTYLHPILYKDKVAAILAIDFSFEVPKQIETALKPLNRSFLFIFGAIFILILLLLIEFYTNYKIKLRSFTDSLTGLYNRHYLRIFLEKNRIDAYQILMLDIDYFKKINDTYGHKAGDIVLAKFADVLRTHTRQEDIIFRYGGEEFLLFVKIQDDKTLAKKVAQRIKESVEKKTFLYETQSIKTTVSIGINEYPQRFKTITQAIKYTDEMLYTAKKEGRNCIITQKDTYKEEKKLSTEDIKEALEQNRVICYYQAIFNTQNREIEKYEALVRIIKKDGTVIPPYFFLEQIFGTTLYTELTHVVIETIFKEIKKTGTKISMNLNFSDILDNKIFETLIGAIEKHKKYAPLLTIELLEYELPENINRIKEKIEQICAYGTKIALDDFGSGYANYEIFKHLPIDILKIDGSLIKDIADSQISLKIVKSIILLANELNIEIVAEFVHSKEVLDVVSKLDIEYLQGFYLAEPSQSIELITK